jgi:hypothetical protein
MRNAQHPVRVVSTEDVNESQLDRIRKVSPRLELLQIRPSPERLAASLPGAEVLFSHFRYTGFDPTLVPRLQWV